MANHPYESHKMLHKHRLGKITKGYAHGGHVHSDEAADKALIKKTVKKEALKVDGKKPHHRADKYARGGRTKGGKTHINVNVMPQNPMQPSRVPVPVPVQTPPAPPAGMAPGAPPPGAMPPGGMPPRPGMMPPGGMPMPMRKSGGRIKDGPTWKEGLRNGTKVQATPGKDHSDNLKKPYPVTRATGGRANFGEKMKAPKQPKHGAAGGLGRLEKTKIEKRVYG